MGIGSLYRHFPRRDALVEAAYHDQVQRLCDAAEELQRVHPPDVALAVWMDGFVSHAAAKRGMTGALQSIVASNTELYANTRTQLLSAIASLLDAATAAGSIRTDMEPDDVLRAISSIWFVTDEQAWHERARRLLQLLMDGLRHGASSP